VTVERFSFTSNDLPMFTKTTIAALLLSISALHAADAPIRLWDGPAPGEKEPVGEEKDTSQPGKGLVAGKPIIRLGNVSDPAMQVFRPAKNLDTGAAVVVCPGGAYNILAYDLEGSEVCEWLNSIGVTGVLLKYRVPARKDRPRHEAAVQDAHRAISLVRQRATEWGIDPNRVGILGFSAGGHLAAVASNSNRTYKDEDAAGKFDCRPNFTILIYPAYLVPKENPTAVSPELPVSAKTPPTFMAISQDDPVKVEGAMQYGLALKAAGVKWELHVYPDGGHGYGLRRTEKVVTTWPDRLADWLKASGWLQAK
jgi:acetyl esterase/lipase